MTPDCMTQGELALWHEANRLLRPSGRAADVPCRDCPMEFAAAMRSEGCCNGEPGRIGPPLRDAADYATRRRRQLGRERARRWRVDSQLTKRPSKIAA